MFLYNACQKFVQWVPGLSRG